MGASEDNSVSTPEEPDTGPRHGIGITIPKLPSRRTDDYYEVRVQFSRKAAGLLISLMIVLSRLIEALGIELFHSIF